MSATPLMPSKQSPHGVSQSTFVYTRAGRVQAGCALPSIVNDDFVAARLDHDLHGVTAGRTDLGPSRVPPAEAPSSVRGVPTILYDGRAIEVSEDEFTTLRDHVVELANSGKYDWLLVDPEDPTWLLIGPGIPVSFDQADPPDFPELLP